MDPGLEHLTFDLADVTIHAAAAGPNDGPLVLLLHGYPEFWYGWRGQIPRLAGAGFRVVVPDQRGYNQSSKPEDWRTYQVSCLVGDVLGIADRLERRRFISRAMIGAGSSHGPAPCGIKTASAVSPFSTPRIQAFSGYARTHPAQILRSWYVFFMQLPWLPECLFEAGNFRAMTETLAKTSRPGTFSEEDFCAYREAWGEPRAPTGMINWYRALRASAPAGNPRLEIPVRILWGARDRFLAAELAELSLRYCKRGELTMFPDATHWLQHEEQAAVSKALEEFFAAQD